MERAAWTPDDEPTVGVDPQSRVKLLELVRAQVQGPDLLLEGLAVSGAGLSQDGGSEGERERHPCGAGRLPVLCRKGRSVAIRGPSRAPAERP